MYWTDDVGGGDYNTTDLSEYLRLRCKENIIATLVDVSAYVIFYRARNGRKVHAVALFGHRKGYRKFDDENVAWAWSLAKFDRVPRMSKRVDKAT